MKPMTTVLLSILAGGLTAFGVVKATVPQTPSEPVTVVKDASGNSVEYRTVNLAETDYPDFTYMNTPCPSSASKRAAAAG